MKKTIGYDQDKAKIYDQIIHFFLETYENYNGAPNQSAKIEYSLMQTLCFYDNILVNVENLKPWKSLERLLISLISIKVLALDPCTSFERQQAEESLYTLINRMTKVLAE